ncbi:MAG TPA: fucose-binding lectin II [Prolixibacteraceae bacterium]|nr:fucose-binding lectin II [Prolixibacteraceae bacterium]
MKKNNLFLCTIFVLVASLFLSCTNENDETLSISLTTQPASAKIYAGTPVTIAGTASTTGKFRMIQMVSNPLDGSAPVDLPEGAVTSCANTGGTVTFSRIITTFSKSTVVKVNVIDMSGGMATTDFTVTIIENNTTAPATAISYYSATTGGNIADIGETVTARGVVYGTEPNPTIALTTKTSDGTGVGTFVSSLTNLLFGQDYFVRSYSVTSKGVLYGNQVTFTTLTPNIPTPTVPNGTFELPVITGFVMNPQPNVWSFSGGGGQQKNGSAFGAATAPEGVQTGLLQGDAQMSQTFTFTAQNLALSFMAAQRSTQKQTIDILIDDVVIGTFQPTSSTWAKYVTKTFTATAGEHKLTIKGTNTYGGDNSAFIDDLKLILRN